MKILIISPNFPPTSGVGTLRVASLTRMLIKCGHLVCVITDRLVDETERKRNFDDALQLARYIYVPTEESTGIRSSKNNGKKYITAFKEAMNNIKPDCLLITCSPFYTLPICKLAVKKYALPCILDFRDPWTFDIRSRRDLIKPKFWLKKIITYGMESEAIHYAKQVVMVTDGWVNLMKKGFPIYANKFALIENGYDEEYVDSLRSVDNTHSNNEETINNQIMVFGKLCYYSEEYTKIFLNGFQMAKAEEYDLKLVQIGEYEPKLNEIINRYCGNLIKVNTTGFCDYAVGLDKLSDAMACVIVDIRKYALGTKVYDYIYKNKPIIYVGPQNTSLSRLVSSFKHGFVCSTPQEVCDSIKTIRIQRLTCLTDNLDISSFSRKKQNEKYIDLINEIACNGG